MPTPALMPASTSMRSARSRWVGGAVFTSVVLTQWPLRRHVGLRLFFAVGIFGLAVIAFGLSRDYVLSYLALVVLGMADNVSVYVRGSIVPLATPDGLRGRVVAVESVFIGASNELGAFVAGSGAALLGPVAAVVVGGSLTLGVAAPGGPHGIDPGDGAARSCLDRPGR